MSRLGASMAAALAACSPGLELDPESGAMGSPPGDRAAWRGVRQWHDGARTSAEGLDVAPDGTLLVAGYGRDTDRFRSFVVAVGPDGLPAWTAHHDPTSDSMARAVGALPDGTAVLATQAKLEPTSNQQWLHLAAFERSGRHAAEVDTLDLWTAEVGDHTVPADLDAAPDGSVAVVGHGAGPTSQAALLARYDAGGALVVDLELVRTRGEVRAAGVALHGDLTAYAVTTTGDAFGDPAVGGHDAWVGVVDAASRPVWSDHIGVPLDQFIGGVAFDATGHLYVCGSSHADLDTGRPHPGGRDLFLRKYDPMGAVLWTAQGGSRASDACADVHVAPDGTVYAAGYWRLDPKDGGHASGFVASFAPDGTQEWFRLIDPIVRARTLAQAVTSDGADVLVCGSTTGVFAGQVGSGDQDAWVARFDRRGVPR